MKPPILALLIASTALAVADTPDQKVDLLSEFGSGKYPVKLVEGKTLAEDPATVFSLTDQGTLRISGDALGYVRTPEKWGNYHLVVEYKWGEHTWANREDRARDAGVFVHCQDPDQAFHKAWPFGIEAQLIEGGSGNLSVLGSKDSQARLSSTMESIGENRFRFAPGGEQRELTGEKVSLFASYRSPDWKDQRGFLGPEDKEELFGNWNRLEVICKGDAITVLLNGQTVNEAKNLPWSEGYIALQTEYAEWFVRRWELYPLGKYEEKWQPEQKSTDTGSGADLLPRKLPLSPAESLAALEIDGPWEVQLVASEPLVNDPVDVVWDAAGNMYVAEMRDYPLPPEHGPLLSRIRLLKDTDQDGFPDASTDWAEPLDHVQGLLSLGGPKDGLLVTTRTQVLRLADTDDDDIADLREVLYQSNDPRHSQLQISCPRWGVDGWIYLNNGLDGKEIYPSNNEGDKVNIERRNLRVHPVTWEIQVVSGFGQFGATIDDFGRRFATTNRSPTIFAIMPLKAVTRNPFAALAQGHEDIAPFGGDAIVYPFEVSHTTSNAHLGTHTAACGTGLYRGSLVPELSGDIFVCEPTGQLVTRAELLPDGASLKAERVRNKPRTEFLRSRDEWFRPVNLRNGPDGALYVCDIYRRFIDHSRFFPEEFSQAHYMRAGFDQGRIYRIVPKGHKARPMPDLTSMNPVEGLKSADSWMRNQAQMALLKPDAKVSEDQVKALRKLVTDGPSAGGRVQALWTLERLGKLDDKTLESAMQDQEPGVVENAAELSWQRMDDQPSWLEPLLDLTRHDHARVRFMAIIAAGGVDSAEVTDAVKAVAVRDALSDPWMRKGLLSAAEHRAGAILQVVTQSKDFPSQPEAGARDFLQEFSAAIAARGHLDELKTVFGFIAAEEPAGDWARFAAINGLADGLRRHQGDLGVKTLAALISKPPQELKDSAPVVNSFLEKAMVTLMDKNQPLPSRQAALSMIRHIPSDAAMGHLEKLIAPGQPAELRKAAIDLSTSTNRAKGTEMLFTKWDDLDPESRDAALAVLARTASVELLKKMKAGEINPGLLDPLNRWSMQRSSNEEVKKLAEELFAQPSGDRAGVMEDYESALAMGGDIQKGQEIFTLNCSMCHKVDGAGMEVGPDISDVRNKPAEALLSDILDPNRMVEARWMGYTVRTHDGRTLIGVVESDSGDAITLKGPAGIRETVTRDQIETIQESGLSLMPVGMEGAINKEQMAHLLAFLRKR